MHVSLRRGPLDVWQELAHHEQRVPSETGGHGATSVFVGTVRDFNEGATVTRLFLEHYPGMTERHLERICLEAAARWCIVDALVVHRVGELRAGESIVLVAVWAAHRASAFEACRYLIEQLKSRAPFWKRETLVGAAQQQRWLDQNTPE